MPLETFAPEQWAQELTAPHYQYLIDEGWPELVVQQSANTIFQFTLLCGQLLMQEPNLTGNAEAPDQPPPVLELSEPLAIQVMDYFAETVRAALAYTLDQGLPETVRSRVIETLAEDVYSYCKQMTLSVAFADPVPERQELGQWLEQTAHEAVDHYKGEYEKEFGPIVAETIDRVMLPPASPQTASEIAHETNDSSVRIETDEIPAKAHAANNQNSINLKLAAVAMLLKSLPQKAHNRILNLFPSKARHDIQTFAADDDWLDTVDHQALNEQLQSLKTFFQQPVNHPGIQLVQLLQANPWSAVRSALKDERPVWLTFLSSLKAGDPPENFLPVMLQNELLNHLKSSPGLTLPAEPGTNTPTAAAL